LEGEQVAIRPSSTARSRMFCVRSRAGELRPRLLGSTELLEQVSAHRGQQLVVGQRPLGAQRLHHVERRPRAERHPDRDGAVQLHDRRRNELGERVIKRDDALPVGVLRDPRLRVAGGDGGLPRVRPERAAAAQRALERGEAAADQQPVPA
jgi:hypothetical protein